MINKGDVDMSFFVIWIIAIAAFIVIEAVTYQLVSIWFVIGSFAGLIAATVGGSFYIQITVFLIVSLITLIALRPISLRLVKSPELKTNVDSLVGKEALITDTVDNINGSGEAKVNGMIWTARSETDDIIPKGTVATIKRIEGVKLILSA